MTPTLDETWAPLVRAWRTETAPEHLTTQIISRARAGTRQRRLVVAGELVLLLALFPVLLMFSFAGGSRWVVVVAASAWAVNFGIFGFALWNRRGTWAAEREVPEAYVALMIARARARVRSARFARWAVLAQAASVVLLVGSRAEESSGPVRSACALAGLAVLIVYWWARGHERRANRDLQDLAVVEDLLKEPSSAGSPEGQRGG